MAQTRPAIVMHFDNEEDMKRYFPILLISKGGHVTNACKSLGITRRRFERWIEEDTEFADTYQSTREQLIDHVESKLLENIDDNNSRDIQFFLKTQARHRGYGERVEHDHSGMIGHAHAIGIYPYEPKSIAEWEKMVHDAEQARKLREDNSNQGPEIDEDGRSTVDVTETIDQTTPSDRQAGAHTLALVSV